MEFSEKLQQLRKQKDLTQEQLAERLFVSRTAISKWESGKGYPNIDSLKGLAKFFEISIDELLSGEELIQIASTENRSNMNRLLGIIYGVLDIMAIAFILLPLYGQPQGDYIRAVSLLDYTYNAPAIIMSYWMIYLALILMGMAELALSHFDMEKWRGRTTGATLTINCLSIIFFFAAKEPYAGTLMFIFFVIKIFAKSKEKH